MSQQLVDRTGAEQVLSMDERERTSWSHKTLGRLLAAVTVMGVLLVSGYLYLQYANNRSALETTKEWARLSDFPSSATDVRVETTGSMFTREFTITFTAPIEDINKWISQCPGPSGATPEVTGSVRHYAIEPGGGAQHAELEIDAETETVRINAWWS